MRRTTSLLRPLLAPIAALTLALSLAPPAPAAPAASAGSPVTQAPTVKAGSVSGKTWVRKAQRRLNELGCQAGPVDGDVGTWTRSAVVRFQSRHGMAQSGRLRAPVRKLLRSPKAQRCDARPVPAASGRGRRIVISQAQNWVWLVGPKGAVLAQGGVVDNPKVLDKGRHVTGSYCGRAARIRKNTTTSGTVWLDNFVRFAPCGIGFHRIPTYKTTGNQMHADYLLGTDFATSHGCIRLSRAMSVRIWNFTARRTVVWVK
ncbi:peptidoglycan-binding protein [Nocardioides ferulae]|uniref:peptidoglycan-binding protein n=1 Tax=Nocardioides ferulae TaxID=2340821 RepID=UPI0013DE3167|nr:peptidoglycan-binding protein [Nocardioides ferulae]